jgi:hypothetical protein
MPGIANPMARMWQFVAPAHPGRDSVQFVGGNYAATFGAAHSSATTAASRPIVHGAAGAMTSISPGRTHCKIENAIEASVPKENHLSCFSFHYDNSAWLGLDSRGFIR